MPHFPTIELFMNKMRYDLLHRQTHYKPSCYFSSMNRPHFPSNSSMSIPASIWNIWHQCWKCSSNWNWWSDAIKAIWTKILTLKSIWNTTSAYHYCRHNYLSSHRKINVCFRFLFYRPKIRFDITSKMDSERRAENKQTLQRIDEDRRHLIEATIVRIMKMRKILSNRILIGEVLSQLTPKFTPKIPHIKVSSQWEKILLNFQFRSMH